MRSGVRRGVIAAAMLAAPLLATALGARALADATAERAASALSPLLDGLPTPAAPYEEPPIPVDVGEEASVVVTPVAPAGSATPSAPPSSASGSAKTAPPPKGLLIGSDLVTRAVLTGMRPGGSPVPAAGARPAGLALHGVGGAGGLHDGDVVTTVAGAAATSVGAVVGAVTAAIRGGAGRISATVWRGDASFPVVVVVPDLVELSAALRDKQAADEARAAKEGPATGAVRGKRPAGKPAPKTPAHATQAAPKPTAGTGASRRATDH